MKKYGLIGKDIGYSKSKTFFQDKFVQENFDGTYDNFELNEIDELPTVLAKNNLDGFNVTIPFKESIIPYLDELSDEAAKIKAVNTVKIVDQKKIGYNTDAFGFMKALFPILESNHSRALILGTGGASKAVAYALEAMGIEYKFVSRSPKEGQLNYEDLNENNITDHKLIINATPLGTYPDIKQSPKIPYDALSKTHLLYDLVYNPTLTEFLAKGKIRGAKIANGQAMLFHQANRSWTIWQE